MIRADLHDELALCARCAVGDREALSAFDARYGREISTALQRMRLSPSMVDDVKQRIYEKLFVASKDAPPKIAAYRGDGTLGAWLRVVVVRTALNAMRGRLDLPLDDDTPTVLADPDDPERALMKLTYRAELEGAFREALSSLDARDRELLRHVFVEGLDPGKVGRLYRVHRTTAMRWIVAARQALRARLRATLAERLRVEDGELDSIIRLVDRFELSPSALER